MSTFRKKPVEVEAFQVGEKFWSDPSAWPNWLIEATKKRDAEPGAAYVSGENMDGIGVVTINTLEPRVLCSTTADVGDWIVRAPDGEIYPVKSDIFEATHEAVGA